MRLSSSCVSVGMCNHRTVAIKGEFTGFDVGFLGPPHEYVKGTISVDPIHRHEHTLGLFYLGTRNGDVSDSGTHIQLQRLGDVDVEPRRTGNRTVGAPYAVADHDDRMRAALPVDDAMPAAESGYPNSGPARMSCTPRSVRSHHETRPTRSDRRHEPALTYSPPHAQSNRRGGANRLSRRLLSANTRNLRSGHRRSGFDPRKHRRDRDTDSQASRQKRDLYRRQTRLDEPQELAPETGRAR